MKLKLEITQAAFDECLRNSPEFRNCIFDQMLTASTPHPLYLVAENLMTTHAGNMVATIKAIRNISEGQRDGFREAFPKSVEPGPYEFGDRLGLAESKNIYMYFQNRRNRI
jgi:hypothetical protein